MTDRAIILERGSIVHDGDSAALKADPALLERYVGVTGAAGDARKARQDARRAATQGGYGLTHCLGAARCPLLGQRTCDFYGHASLFGTGSSLRAFAKAR